MSYTNINLVRNYLLETLPNQSKIMNQSIKLTGTDYISFFKGTISSDDFYVKSNQAVNHIRKTQKVLSDTHNFSSVPVIESSVVVASDSSLGTVYTENSDYIIDYTQGNLNFKSSGLIETNQYITIWYKNFTIYVLNVDYSINTDLGQIKRIATGDIADGESVCLDYSPVSTVYDETIIENAVASANGLIESEVDSSGSFGSDRTLQTAATYKALEIICQAAAVRDMAKSYDNNKNVSVWIKLAEMFQKNSEALIKKFRPPFEQLNSPTHG